MRIILFANTGFGTLALEELLQNQMKILAVVTRKRYKGRHPHFRCKQISTVAREAGISVYAGANPQDSEFQRRLAALCPDILISVTYHRIIPEKVIRIPRLAAVNFHPSLLPAYRGASPTNWAIVNGDVATGVTAHYLTHELDAGDIILQERCPITITDTDGTLRLKLARLTSTMVMKVCTIFRNRKVKGKPQDESLASFQPNRTSEDGHIVWSVSGREIYNRIRGMLPFPGAYFSWDDQQINIRKARLLTTVYPAQKPGTILQVFSPNCYAIQTQDAHPIKIWTEQPLKLP